MKKPCPSCYVLHTPDKCPTLVKKEEVAAVHIMPPSVVTPPPPPMLRGTLGGFLKVKTGDPFQEVIRYVGDESCDLLATFATHGLCYRPAAKIRWGHEGRDLIADVDVHIGLQVAILGAHASVSVGFDPEPVSGEGEIGAMLSFLKASKMPVLTRTLHLDALAPGEVRSVFVPAFATTVRVAGEDAIDLIFRDGDGKAVYMLSRAKSADGVVPIACDIESIAIKNKGRDKIDVALEFAIELPR